MATEPNSGGFQIKLSGLPAWAQTLLQITLQYGVGTALAIFLVFRLSTNYTAAAATTQKTLDEHAMATIVKLTAIDEHLQTDREDTKTMIVLLRQLCIMTAKTDSDKRECSR